MAERRYVQHVVNEGLNVEGQQLCRRCKEPIPLIGSLVKGFREGSLIVEYEGSEATAVGLSGPPDSEECVA